MNTQKLNDWLQIVGIFAVVASLVFVGLQLKQSQDIALSQSSQARAAISIETLISTTENPHYISAVAKGRTGRRNELTTEEQVTMSQYAIAVLMSHEDQYFQYSNGFVTEERWQAARSNLKNFMREEANIPVRQAYEYFPERYSRLFQEVVSELIAEIDSSSRSD